MTEPVFQIASEKLIVATSGHSVVHDVIVHVYEYANHVTTELVGTILDHKVTCTPLKGWLAIKFKVTTPLTLRDHVVDQLDTKATEFKVGVSLFIVNDCVSNIDVWFEVINLNLYPENTREYVQVYVPV